MEWARPVNVWAAGPLRLKATRKPARIVVAVEQKEAVPKVAPMVVAVWRAEADQKVAPKAVAAWRAEADQKVAPKAAEPVAVLVEWMAP